jgi:hypothetical protein
VFDIKKFTFKKHRNKHHIIPRSREHGKELTEPPISQENYHFLFFEKEPLQIVGWLNERFWENRYLITIKKRGSPPKYYKKRHYNVLRSRSLRKKVLLTSLEHYIYHLLFSNMIPQEIIYWLNEKYWDNAYRITIKERNDRP